jgi:8-oxo-dGTP pyrophosphatase MutT (NUDIX family)
MKVAKVIIINPEGQYLLLTRDNHPLFGFDADIPGGVVETAEIPVVAAIRELIEETGIRATPDELALLYSGTDYSAHGTEYNVYLLELLEMTDIQLSWEHARFAWVSREAFLQSARSAHDSFMQVVATVLQKRPSH